MLILFAAFLALLNKGWLWVLDRGMQSVTIPELRAKERECRLQSLQGWRVPELMALLPMFLQKFLAFFFVGPNIERKFPWLPAELRVNVLIVTPKKVLNI